MQRRLVMSAAIMDVEEAEIASLTRVTYLDVSGSKPHIVWYTLPTIAFTGEELDQAQGLLKKLWEVAEYPDNLNSPVVTVCNQNIMLVDHNTEEVKEEPVIEAPVEEEGFTG